MSETKRRNHGRGHSYLLDGSKVPGVTTLISKGFPKPGLIDWAAESVAAKAIDQWDDLLEMTPSERYKALARAHIDIRNAAGTRGTRVHTLAQKLVAGEQVEVPEELEGLVGSCVRFLNEWYVKEELVERPVFSREHQYAGSPDLVGTLTNPFETWLLDWKTSRKGAYGDMAFQLAAYRHAEFYLDDDDLEQPMPEIDRAGIVWLRDDGYDLIPIETGPEVFRQFLYIAEVARAAEDCRDYLDDPLLPGMEMA